MGDKGATESTLSRNRRVCVPTRITNALNRPITNPPTVTFTMGDERATKQSFTYASDGCDVVIRGESGVKFDRSSGDWHGDPHRDTMNPNLSESNRGPTDLQRMPPRPGVGDASFTLDRRWPDAGRTRMRDYMSQS